MIVVGRLAVCVRVCGGVGLGVSAASGRSRNCRKAREACVAVLPLQNTKNQMHAIGTINIVMYAYIYS